MLSNDGFTEKSNCTAMHSVPFLRNYHSNFLRKFKGKRIFDHQFVIEWRIPQPLYWSTMEMACNESKTSTGPWSHHISCRTFGVSLICVHSRTHTPTHTKSHSNTGTQTLSHSDTQTLRDTHTNKQRLKGPHIQTDTHSNTDTHTLTDTHRKSHSNRHTASPTSHPINRHTYIQAHTRHVHTHTHTYTHTV